MWRRPGIMFNDIRIYYKTCHKDAIIPEYEKHGDAACSLRVVEDYVVKPSQRILAKTGLKIVIPEGFEGQVRPRSGNAWKKGLTVVNTPGTIDSGYRGEVMVALINLGDKEVVIKKGDAVAQLKFSPVYKGHFIEVRDLEESDRGQGGFGSTGN
jgi:dUTP pyrophosphatase